VVLESADAADDRRSSFTRERQMKFWKRAWKLQPIERFNPAWRDLFEDME
jgi:putative endonuclease